MAEVKYIVYKLGEQKYSMKLSEINGIEHTYNVVPVPLGAQYIKGIIHLREKVIPIYDLKEKFNITDVPAVCNKQILISETHGISLAFEVDDVIGIVPVPEENIKEIPDVVKTDETGYLENVVKVVLPDTKKGDIMLSISVDRIMSDKDFEKVSNALESTQTEE